MRSRAAGAPDSGARGRLVLILSALAILLAAASTALAATHHSRHAKQPKLSAKQAKALARASRTDRVIIFLKPQFHAALVGTRAFASRASETQAAQAPLISQLRAARASHVQTYQLVDAVSGTVSRSELARLRHDSDVSRVVPDLLVSVAQPTTTTSRAGKVHSDTATQSPSSPTLHTIPGACSSGTPQLDPEGLSLTHTDSDTPGAQTARSLGITGAGVKVAYIADGVDPQNINFIRADGHSVFFSYKDFSGDGPNEPTTGGEAFLDANTIAGQGLHTYNVQNFGTQSDPTACNIRIEGVAPGASLAGFNVFGENELALESNFLEAINYAVETDHVNVINESFIANNFPDTADDVTKEFDNAAIAAGVTVTASTGDAGPFNTEGSPADDPNVISAGASTDFRFYAQTNYAAARYFATSGWLDDNISSLSSSGFDEAGQTVDLVAPGDLSFASCDASSEYSECTNFQDDQTQPSDVEESGGTSESSPFVAGAAALVIQAYRQTHGGVTPTPALVKRILLSTAADLGAPAQEQGAGLLDSYKAVELAESISTGNGSPKPVGSTLLTSTNQLNDVGHPGAKKSWTVDLTNTGASSQKVGLSSVTFGPQTDIQGGSVNLEDASSPQFENYAGVANNYQEVHFTVPAGEDHLVAQLAWQANPADCSPSEACDGDLNSRVRMILITPSGQLAAHSLPQGSGQYGTAEVDAPAAGTWTGVIFGDDGADGGTEGPVQWQVGVQRYRGFGSVSPKTLTLAPGKTGAFKVTEKIPQDAGDSAGSVVIDSAGSYTTIPVTLRSRLAIKAGGTFSGVLTGGNGRPDGQGQEQFYEFEVPAGTKDITSDLQFLNDPQDPVAEYLVSPDGDTLGYGQNEINGSYETALTANAYDPTPGRWTLVVAFAEPTVGNEISQPYTGKVLFNVAKASAKGLPDSFHTKLAAGKTVTVPVKITNTGIAPEDYFIDARLDKDVDETLASFTSDTLTLPATSEPVWLVPSETSSVDVVNTASVPATFDFEPDSGDPDIASSAPGSTYGCKDTETGNYTAPDGAVTTGLWYAGPDECGPYSGPAPKASDTANMTVETKAFDAAVSSPTGDLWKTAVDPTASFSPVTIEPGRSATVDVKIIPVGKAGLRVSGDLYVDDFDSDVPPPVYAQLSGDEVTAIPYAYKIK